MTSAIICEFNPFHYGHASIIENAKRNGPVVILMSGCFVQRGEPALYDKYLRAKAAILSGADLVLELPYPYCCSYAQSFAEAAVGIISGLGFVDGLVFGTENYLSPDKLRSDAERLNGDVFRDLSENIRREDPTLSDIAVRKKTYEVLFGGIFEPSPNDILALEYVSAVLKTGSGLDFRPLRRAGGYSAHKSRELLDRMGQDALYDIMPENCAKLFAAKKPAKTKRLGDIILASVRLGYPERSAAFEGCGGGFSQKAYNAAGNCSNYSEFIETLTDKTTTRASARRRLLNALFEVTEEDLKTPPAWTMVLGANETGRELLKNAESKIDILTKPSAGVRQNGNDAFSRQFELETRAESVYALLCGEKGNSFLTRGPYIEKNDT